MFLVGNPAVNPSKGTARHMWRADGAASVLGIGTANPANCVRQEDYADYYFSVTKSEHLGNLKAKLKRICHKSAIQKRYFHLTEELLNDHPELLDRTVPSLDARQGILASAVPELTAAAASKAIAEWGRPATEITHLVVSTFSGAHMPGADHRLASLLGLRPFVRRTMLYMHGCSSGSAALRMAKDIAENNHGARVLVACAELTLIMFRAPHGQANNDDELMVMQALFGDGAAAAVVGADPINSVENPDFEMISASQTTIPDTAHLAAGQFRDDGMLFHPSKELPSLVRDNIEHCMAGAFAPLGITAGGWNDLFWAVHPGGRPILDSVEAGLRLEPGKLWASRKVLSEYGNMSGPSVIFVLDELRRTLEDKDQDQEGRQEMGVVLGIGPGSPSRLWSAHWSQVGETTAWPHTARASSLRAPHRALYAHGCSSGSAALRVANDLDLAVNSHGARVLTVIPETEHPAAGRLREDGLLFHSWSAVLSDTEPENKENSNSPWGPPVSDPKLTQPRRRPSPACPYAAWAPAAGQPARPRIDAPTPFRHPLCRPAVRTPPPPAPPILSLARAFHPLLSLPPRRSPSLPRKPRRPAAAPPPRPCREHRELRSSTLVLPAELLSSFPSKSPAIDFSFPASDRRSAASPKLAGEPRPNSFSMQGALGFTYLSGLTRLAQAQVHRWNATADRRRSASSSPH
ncbi:hypothetical protein PR202_ga12970 [Eleusine coracana subsp. coracana]|uniref:Chalcone synthase n=1 Tax=Eleusine coracana subsp. coracana TaxID=191504 RepID=A0AAV5CCX1_ELECO|nr:hypothetical protein PR202_ga12970 [Eleusine coracana subsp. coracana]